MLRLSFTYRDVEKEEIFLNHALTKGWLFVKRSGCIYQFRKIQTSRQLIRVEVVQTADMPLLKENVDVIASKLIKNKGMTLVYYLIEADPRMAELRNLSREPQHYLNYYNWLHARQTLIMYGCVIPLIVLISYWGTLAQKRSATLTLLAIVLVITIVITYARVSQQSKKKIKEYRLLNDDYSEQLTLRFIVKVPLLVEKKRTDLQRDLGYLGKWDYRLSDNKQSYFYLNSNTNEVEIKSDLSDYFGESAEIEVVSPLALYPLGYF